MRLREEVNNASGDFFFEAYVFFPPSSSRESSSSASQQFVHYRQWHCELSVRMQKGLSKANGATRLSLKCRDLNSISAWNYIFIQSISSSGNRASVGTTRSITFMLDLFAAKKKKRTATPSSSLNLSYVFFFPWTTCWRLCTSTTVQFFPLALLFLFLR